MKTSPQIIGTVIDTKAYVKALRKVLKPVLAAQANGTPVWYATTNLISTGCLLMENGINLDPIVIEQGGILLVDRYTIGAVPEHIKPIVKLVKIPVSADFTGQCITENTKIIFAKNKKKKRK